MRRVTVMSWNVNSVRARERRLLGVLERHRPDLLCLQELKTEAAGFPHASVEAAGYRAVIHGQKTYNGVAVLTRLDAPAPAPAPEDVERGFGDGVDDPQARFVVVRHAGLQVASAYVPNGSTVGSEKWAYKQAWYARLLGWLRRRDEPASGRPPAIPLVLGGDFNVAADERDVRNPAAWESSVLYHPDARALLAGLREWGLVDTFRQHCAEAGRFSWWDYRAGAFPKDDGLRIDYLFATPDLAPRCVAAGIDRDERKVIKDGRRAGAQRPADHRDDLASDHVPVWATFELPDIATPPA